MSFEIDIDSAAATFEYDANASFAGAVVYVFNRDAGRGVIDVARADGSVGADRAVSGPTTVTRS